MLGAPPAFVLSQDQTLNLNSCSGEHKLLLLFILKLLLLCHFRDYLKGPSSILWYCSIFKVLLCPLASSAGILFYHIPTILSTAFLSFFQSFFAAVFPLLADSFLIIPLAKGFVNTFFDIFCNFFNFSSSFLIIYKYKSFKIYNVKMGKTRTPKTFLKFTDDFYQKSVDKLRLVC